MAQFRAKIWRKLDPLWKKIFFPAFLVIFKGIWFFSLYIMVYQTNLLSWFLHSFLQQVLRGFVVCQYEHHRCIIFKIDFHWFVLWVLNKFNFTQIVMDSSDIQIWNILIISLLCYYNFKCKYLKNGSNLVDDIMYKSISSSKIIMKHWTSFFKSQIN